MRYHYHNLTFQDHLVYFSIVVYVNDLIFHPMISASKTLELKEEMTILVSSKEGQEVVNLICYLFR